MAHGAFTDKIDHGGAFDKDAAGGRRIEIEAIVPLLYCHVKFVRKRVDGDRSLVVIVRDAPDDMRIEVEKLKFPADIQQILEEWLRVATREIEFVIVGKICGREFEAFPDPGGDLHIHRCGAEDVRGDRILQRLAETVLDGGFDGRRQLVRGWMQLISDGS